MYVLLSQIERLILESLLRYNGIAFLFGAYSCNKALFVVKYLYICSFDEIHVCFIISNILIHRNLKDMKWSRNEIFHRKCQYKRMWQQTHKHFDEK